MHLHIYAHICHNSLLLIQFQWLDYMLEEGWCIWEQFTGMQHDGPHRAINSVKAKGISPIHRPEMWSNYVLMRFQA